MVWNREIPAFADKSGGKYRKVPAFAGMTKQDLYIGRFQPSLESEQFT
jgi:hypothetical protein